LGESGCDAKTLARIAGHSSIAISSRYVHRGKGAILATVEWLAVQRIGHSEKGLRTRWLRRLLKAQYNELLICAVPR
jgi:hypothetical protein